MSYGIQSWGTGSWGGSDFAITNHIPSDNSVGVNRLTTISFTLYSQSGNVIPSSINLTANGVPLITSGAFTIFATGNINNTDPAIVNVTATVTHAFAPFQVVTVLVSALNASSVPPVLGTTWQFTTDNQLMEFSNYIVNRFEKVLRINVTGLDAPRNPQAIVFLAPPPNLQVEVI